MMPKPSRTGWAERAAKAPSRASPMRPEASRLPHCRPPGLAFPTTPGEAAGEAAPDCVVSSQKESEAVPPRVSARLVAVARNWSEPLKARPENWTPETQLAGPMFFREAWAEPSLSKTCVAEQVARKGLSCQSGPSSKFQ